MIKILLTVDFIGHFSIVLTSYRPLGQITCDAQSGVIMMVKKFIKIINVKGSFSKEQLSLMTSYETSLTCKFLLLILLIQTSWV